MGSLSLGSPVQGPVRLGSVGPVSVGSIVGGLGASGSSGGLGGSGSFSVGVGAFPPMSMPPDYGARNVSFDGTERGDSEDSAYCQLEDRMASLSVEKLEFERKNKLLSQELAGYKESHESTQARIKQLSAKLIKLSDFEYKERETAGKLEVALRELEELRAVAGVAGVEGVERIGGATGGV
ncbi:hypothetical protein B484DRAFT_453699, partial [Ochromonadaceae sp. CCMP2298]